MSSGGSGGVVEVDEVVGDDDETMVSAGTTTVGDVDVEPAGEGSELPAVAPIPQPTNINANTGVNHLDTIAHPFNHYPARRRACTRGPGARAYRYLGVRVARGDRSAP